MKVIVSYADCGGEICLPCGVMCVREEERSGKEEDGRLFISGLANSESGCTGQLFSLSNITLNGLFIVRSDRVHSHDFRRSGLLINLRSSDGVMIDLISKSIPNELDHPWVIDQTNCLTSATSD